MGLLAALRSRIQYKIILPFLLLTLLVALAGSGMAFLFIVGSAQERLNNQLAQVGRASSDSVVAQESANLAFLREVAFAGANPSGAPAVADALAAGDIAGLERALDPFVRVSAQRGVRVDRLIAFDRRGSSVLDWEQIDNGSGTVRVDRPLRDLTPLWFVRDILAGTQDARGDKYAGLLDPGDGGARYLFTAVPVTDGQEIVGGLIVGVRMDTLLRDLGARSQAAIITVYQPTNGQAFASTIAPSNGLATLDIRPKLIPAIRDLDFGQDHSIFDVITVNERDYQVAYTLLYVRGEVVGVMSVALAADYVIGPWTDARLPLAGLTISLMVAIIGLGVYIARQITRPLEELVATAQAVTAGDLERRSGITSSDEVGVLSDSFNEMTAHLLDLYAAVRAEASQRAAIVESLADGLVLCDPDGLVLMMNRAMRALLGIADADPGPARFTDMPLQPLGETALAFGDARTRDLFQLGERVVRVVVTPVEVDGALIGRVYVLQDLTSEVAINRAKNNFIATISHELRTPLTVIGGNADLLLRNLLGPLSEEQRVLLEATREHTSRMTALVNNVITIAGLESGTLTFDIEPIDLSDLLSSTLFSIRKAISAKGLELRIELPEDLPEVLVDEHQLRIVLQQLLDNAQRYTEKGCVTLRASSEGAMVRIDISDTGVGIAPDLRERLFTRFARSADDNNSAERGIGLGLAIVKQLIERQGGQVWLEQSSSQGSTFSFTVPCVVSETQPDSYDRGLATAA